MKHITIEVSPEGNVKIEGHEFKGAECERATKAFEEALGAVADKKKKPEFHQTIVKTQTS